jgi:hypothetical protein
MGVETFTTSQFETALLAAWRKVTGEADTEVVKLGLVQGEYVYRVVVNGPAGIAIDVRSSIGYAGTSAGCGEDSIRLVVRYSDGTGWRVRGKGPDAYTTRVKGWERRLEGKLAGLYAELRGIRARVPAGGQLCKVKQGQNQGRFFARREGSFACWLD